MNREGAETYLRLLAERRLRGPLPPVRGQAWVKSPWRGLHEVSGGSGVGGDSGVGATMMTVSQALTAVRALDEETVVTILADFNLAVSVRARPDPSAPPAGGAQARPGRMRFARSVPMIRGGVGPHSPPGGFPAGATGPAGVTGLAGPGSGGATGPAGAGSGGATGLAGPGSGGAAGNGEPAVLDRFMRLGGLRIPYCDEVLNVSGETLSVSGEVFLLSFAHTATEAQFGVAWRVHSSSAQAGLPRFSAFTVTDDRGRPYHLRFPGPDDPEWSGDVQLWPVPPADLRWLDIRAPDSPSVRVGLDPAEAPPGAEPVVSPLALSPGEQLLILWAERLLTAVPEAPHDPWPPPNAGLPGPLHTVAAGFGEVIAALQAADVLSPLSRVPGQLAAVCASLQVSGHGITAPPARDLPEPWLSLLAHYQRRKPDTTAGSDGYAAVPTALPELDGIRLALLGVLNAGGHTWIKLLARGPGAKYLGGAPPGVDDQFPLSFWIRDNGGRWHASRLAGVRYLHGEWAVKLQLLPPLARSTTSIEVLAAGRSAQVRIRLPLHWGFPP